MRLVLVLMAALGLLVWASCVVGGGCPCGASPEDPYALHDPAYPGTHQVEQECVCQCGDDPRFAVPRERSCDELSDACRDRQGEAQQLICE